MRNGTSAACVRGSALFLALWLPVAGPCSAQGSGDTSRSPLDMLVEQAIAQVSQRYASPIGTVAERRRDRVFVLLRQPGPEPGTLLEVVRTEAGGGERVVARLEVLHAEAGLAECRQRERVGRAQSEPGDHVRVPARSQRILVAPCVALVDMPPEIPEVVGERLRAALLVSPAVRVVEDDDAERGAEAAYLGGGLREYLVHQRNVTEVVVPVLLVTPAKLILNVEYFSVERGRATEIDAASVALDDHLRSWLQAGAAQPAPPGFKRLPPQVHAWRVSGLHEAAPGSVVAVDSDSVHVLAFEYPGLRLRASATLGPRQRRRRDTWCTLVRSNLLSESGSDLAPGLHLVSEERRPQMLMWNAARPDAALQVRAAPAELEPALERLWTSIRPLVRKAEVRWWPGPGVATAVILPCFADLDADGRVDALWSAPDGTLLVKLAAQRAPRSFAGFGDVKAVQAGHSPVEAPTLWLTDTVWHGTPDRLHAARLHGDAIQVLWSSEPFAGTFTALASADLNADGLADLVAAESVPGGTRLHAFLALAGDRSLRAPRTASEGRR